MMVIVKNANDLNATNHMASNLHGTIVPKFDMHVVVLLMLTLPNILQGVEAKPTMFTSCNN
jgi:hypothetical protein